MNWVGLSAGIALEHFDYLTLLAFYFSFSRKGLTSHLMANTEEMVDILL